MWSPNNHRQAVRDFRSENLSTLQKSWAEALILQINELVQFVGNIPGRKVMNIKKVGYGQKDTLHNCFHLKFLKNPPRPYSGMFPIPNPHKTDELSQRKLQNHQKPIKQLQIANYKSMTEVVLTKYSENTKNIHPTYDSMVARYILYPWSRRNHTQVVKGPTSVKLGRPKLWNFINFSLCKLTHCVRWFIFERLLLGADTLIVQD